MLKCTTREINTCLDKGHHGGLKSNSTLPDELHFTYRGIVSLESSNIEKILRASEVVIMTVEEYANLISKKVTD